MSDQKKQMTGVDLIAAERERQVSQEGWTFEHDDKHDAGEIACAAACYALATVITAPKVQDSHIYARYWPWERLWWKPSDDKVRNLVRAGALIAAEIDRIQRGKVK